MNDYQWGQEPFRLSKLAFVLPGWILLLSLTACESSLMREFNHHMSGNDLQTTHRVLDRELAANPNNAEASYLKGNLLSRQKEYAEANTYFERSLRNSSMFREHIEYLKERNFRTEFNAGLEAQENRQHELAARQYNLAIDIFPERTEPMPLLGSVYETLNRTDDAAAIYGRCLRLEATHYECGLRLAEIEFNRDNYSESIHLANTLREAYPEDWRPLQLLTEAYMENGQYEQAEGTFAALRNLQSSYRTLKNTAISFYNHGEVRRAERLLRDCLAQQPNDTDVLRALSSIYLDSRNYELVIEAGNRLLRIEPDNRAVKAKLMIAYELIGDIDNYKTLQEELEQSDL